jgi:hypothetical protein
MLMAFDRQRAGTLDASYLVSVDGRLFEFAVRDGHLAAARGEPEVRLTASAKDLVELRLATDPKILARVASRLEMEGSERAKSRFRTTFALPGPG